jgi:hypothetical protein
VSEVDWPEISGQLNFDFKIDNHFEEFKDAEILSNRLNTLNMIAPFVGKYYSDMWIRRNVLQQTDEEIADMMQEMAEEMPPPETMIPDQEVNQGFAGMKQQEQDQQAQQKPNNTNNKANIPGKGSAY